MGEPIDVESIVRVVDEVHPPALVCARVGRPTVVCDGIDGLLLVEGTDGWQWLEDATKHPLHDLEALRRLVVAMASSYALEPPSRLAQAEQYVDAQRVRWIREAEASPPPRLWGLCAPGRLRCSSPRIRTVLYDAPEPITPEQIAAEAERMHLDAHVCTAPGQPTLVDDGVSWVMFFVRRSGWHWSLDGQDQGLVQDYLALQVILAERARVYAAVDRATWRRAVEHVLRLSQVSVVERYRWAREHAKARGGLVRTAVGLDEQTADPPGSSEGRG